MGSTKPHICKRDEIWWCFCDLDFYIGDGLTPKDAYMDWWMKNK